MLTVQRGDVWEITKTRQVEIVVPIISASIAECGKFFIGEKPPEGSRLIHREVPMTRDQMGIGLYCKDRSGNWFLWWPPSQAYWKDDLIHIDKAASNNDIMAVGYEKDKPFWERHKEPEMVMVKVPREEAEANGWEVLDER